MPDINSIQDTFPASWGKPSPSNGPAINSVRDTFPTAWKTPTSTPTAAPTASGTAHPEPAPGPSSAPANVPPDVSYLARTAFGEGEGEGLDGQRAILHVIANRLGKRPGWSSVQQVVQAPHQFESWAKGNLRRPVMEGLDLNDPKLAPLVKLAQAVLSGKDPDNTGGANLFYNPTKASPPWASSVNMTKKIGRHQFAAE